MSARWRGYQLRCASSPRGGGSRGSSIRTGLESAGNQHQLLHGEVLQAFRHLPFSPPSVLTAPRTHAPHRAVTRGGAEKAWPGAEKGGKAGRRSGLDSVVRGELPRVDGTRGISTSHLSRPSIRSAIDSSAIDASLWFRAFKGHSRRNVFQYAQK
jgi:hypothetical protein